MSLVPSYVVPPEDGSVSLSDFHQGDILFIKKHEHVLDKQLHLSGIKHPALVVQKERLRDGQIMICPVRKVWKDYHHLW